MRDTNFGGKNRAVRPPAQDFDTVTDALTGHVKGIRISACRACGRYPSIVHAVSGVCGRGTCIRSRVKRHRARVAARKAAAWMAKKAEQ
jgi:hypothetical protein